MTRASPGNSGPSSRHEQVQEKGQACISVPGGEAIYPFSVFSSCLRQIYGKCKHLAWCKEAVGVVLAPKVCSKKGERSEGWS